MITKRSVIDYCKFLSISLTDDKRYDLRDEAHNSYLEVIFLIFLSKRILLHLPFAV